MDVKEQLKKSSEATKTFWKNLSKKLKIVIITVLVVLIILALVLSVKMNKVEYVVIYEDLTTTEANEILSALQESGVEVKVQNGDTILVPAENETAVRMALATQGYPKSGLTYYLLEENAGLLSTDYERKQYEKMQLQERLGASIETLEGVKQAIVTIAIEDQNVFYLTEKTEPSASVVVHMKKGYTLGEEHILGIRNLVASSVPGLKKENIDMVDGEGNNLLTDEILGINGGTKAMELAREIETRIKQKVENVLEAPYGKDNFKVSVTASIDSDNRVTEEMTYYPSPDGDNTGVVYEETHATDNYQSTEQDGGVPGTSTNADVATYPTYDGQSESSSSSTSDNIKYDVSYVKTLLEKNGAYIDGLSIGVVVNRAQFDVGERENLTELVAFAAGVPEESVSVQGFRFYVEPEDIPEVIIDKFNKNILYIAAAAVLLLILIAILIILAMRKKKKKMEAEALAEAERLAQEQAVATAFGEPIFEPQKIEPVSDPVRQEIKDFATENPQIAAQLIRTWLRSEEDR